MGMSGCGLLVVLFVPCVEMLGIGPAAFVTGTTNDDHPGAARSRIELTPPGVDAELAKRAQLVVRAVRVTDPKRRGKKYTWYRVGVLQVLKNDTESKPPDLLKVAALGIKPGIPEGQSILYLVPYNRAKGALLWKLLGGGADEGVRRPPADPPGAKSSAKSH